MNISNKEIGELIKNKRIESGYSQYQVAKLLGYDSDTSIAYIEKGIASITVEQLQEFSKILNFEISEIFEKNDSKKEWKCRHCGNHSFLIITTQNVDFVLNELKNAVDQIIQQELKEDVEKVIKKELRNIVEQIFAKKLGEKMIKKVEKEKL